MFKIFRKNNLRKDTRTEKRNDMFKLKWSNPLGFPHKPSAICYDSKCHLLAIGTSFGLIRVYGKPGVCYYGQFSYDIEIVKLEFILGKGILICLTNDNMLTLWKLTSNRSIKMIIFSKINKEEFIITCFSVMNASFVICGTDLGNVCFLGLPQLNRIVKKDIFFSKIHSIVNIKSQMNYRRIQKITVCPCDSEKWIIAFSRSLIVIYNIENDILLYSFTHEEELQDICWNPSGKSFIMSTVHGSYIQWNLHESSAGIPKTPYGPDPCKPMNNIFVSSLETYGEDILIFSGGMPRRDYGTKNTLSIMVSNIHVALDFTSRLVNFIVITSKLDNISLNDSLEISKNACNKKFCIILTEEEILCIDLEDYSEKSKFGLYYMPYMQSIHATPITCFYVYENPCQAFIAALRHMAEIDKISYLNPDKYIINGGNVVPNESCLEKMMVITGHEDGSVSFWTNVRGHLNLIYRFTTLSEYGRSNLIDYGMDEEIDEFPPFHKIGIFDPCSDDPRYSIRTILYDTCSKRLFVGCQAGQILIYQFENFEEGELDCEISKNLEYEPQKCVNEGECIDFGSVVTINITESQPLYKWKGNPKLNMSSFSNSKHTNLYTFSIYRRIQFNPPAAILLLKYNSDNEILTASTLHGIIIFDVVQNIVMIKKCTLTQLDYNDVGEGFPRQNSLKKSLRQSMRRIRIRRSRRNKSHKTKTFNQEHEVQIQSRSNKEPLSLIGRVCHFSMCKLLKYYKPRLCVWIGCSSGKILCYMLSFPQADQRLVNPVQCELAKTINIKHAAPIIYLTTLDENFSPFQNKDSIEPEENESVSQILLVCTEEQIKLFSIPQLSPVHKLKITARSGLKISTAKVVLLSNKQNYKENFLFVLFNNGKSDIFSLPQMKPLCSSFSRSIKDDNILAIKSAFMCNNGVCAFSSSVSEFQFFTLSNSINLVPDSVCNFVAGSTEKVNGSRSENGSKIENGTQLNGLTTDTTICSEMTIDSVKDYLLTPNINEPRKPLSPTIENVSVELDNIKS